MGQMGRPRRRLALGLKEKATAQGRRRPGAPCGATEVLRAQLEQLREDHDSLRECLCAAGLLTPGELAAQRQLRLCSSRFHCLCRMPALMRSVASGAGSEAMSRFAAASSTASSACRSVLLMETSADAEATSAIPASSSSSAGATSSGGSSSSSLLSRFLLANPPGWLPGVEGTVTTSQMLLFAQAATLRTGEAASLPASGLSDDYRAPAGPPVALSPSQELQGSVNSSSSSSSSSSVLPPSRPPSIAALVTEKLVLPNQVGVNSRALGARFFARLMGISWRGAEERPRPLVESLMELKEVVRNVGHTAGATAAFTLCETCRGAAEGLRQILPLLSREAPFIYVCGGSCGVAMDSAERFSPRTGQWETLPSMCMPRRACATASTGGRFYVMGGVDVPRFNAGMVQQESFLLSGNMEDKYRPERFDPCLNRWELLPPMNRPYTHAAATALGGFVYLFGGLSFGNVLDQAQRFDPASEQWEYLEPMPTPRFECTAAATKGYIYVLGGSNICGEPLAVAECYNPGTGQWQTLPRMRQARYGCAAASLKGNVYVFGGHGLWEILSDAEFYHVELDRWHSLEPMPVQRNHCGAAAAGEKIYVFGGHTSGKDIMTIDCLDPETSTWEVVAHLPKPRSHCMTVTVQP
eukprot:TRINITY_DN9727_c0_g1_i1.p1 TRINITY_DN9727_c0_g1~~TRINITY_DN9727_c0_g1_i1.p1  ORF type:complete len:657 (-),score=112.85 TRINITY_DN9727_c0_g1_i1:15-1934(-)